MKFLCVPCDSPMKLQTVGPPERGSLSVVYSCPECGYEMAMLTNAYETQVVQSLGVRIGPERREASTRRARRGGKCPFAAMMPGDGRGAAASARAGEPIPVRWTAAAEARLANIPEFVRPMARTGIERFARERGALEVDETDPRRGPRLLRHVTRRPIMNMPHLTPSPFARPYVVSWNLTYRCNLACEHCYLDAGGTPQVGTENFADRSELGTEECFRVIDEIAAFAPECVTILTGGEPLLRRDILEIVRRAAERGLWVVVGTNGVRITENVARRLAEAGARGLSLSLDALDPDRHDRFRKVRGAWRNTVEGAEILNRTGLPFIVQTTAGSHNLGELDAIADFAHDRLAAKVWNLYFLVPTGRGQFVSDITPAQYDEVLASLYRIQRKYDRRMLVNAKCAPHYIKTVLENAGGRSTRLRAGHGWPSLAGRPDQDLLRRGRRVPGGDALHGDTAERGCHPLPLPPGLRGDSSQLESRGPLDVLGAVRRHSPPHLARRAMRGVRDERPLRGLPRPGLRDDRRSDGRRSALHPHPRHVRRVSPARHPRPRVGARGGARALAAIEYGPESPTTIAWDDAAAARMKKIPAFVRGMVVRAVEESCRKSGLDRVTVEELERIRARMPTPKMFG